MSPGFHALSQAVRPTAFRHAGVGRRPARVAADIEPRLLAEAELLRPGLHLRPVRPLPLASLEVAVADVVEVGVAGLRERRRERHRHVRVRVPVLELLLVEPVGRGRRALEVLVRRQQSVRDRSQRCQRLERRAGRIDACDRTVDAGVVPLLRDLLDDERLELLRVRPADVDRRLVGRVRCHRQDGAVARVERDDRAAVRVEVVVLVGELDALAERALSRLLQADVERQPDVVARHRGPARLEAPERLAERVDAELVHPGRPAQPAVVGRLDPGLADLLAAADVAVLRLLELLQLLGRDLADVAEQLRRQCLVLVVAQIGARHLDAREVGPVLEQRRDLILVHGRLDEDRGQRIALVLLERLRQPRQRHAEDLREPLEHRVAPLLGQVGRPDPHSRARDVRDDRAARAVEDGAALRLDPDRPQLVVLGRVHVPVAREHLQRPEPEEEDREDQQGEPGEHADPQRQLRREAVGLGGLRIGRQEPARRRAPLRIRASQGASPRSRARTRTHGRAPTGRARRPDGRPRG